MPRNVDRSTSPGQSVSSHLEQALAFLFHMEQFDPNQARLQIFTDLNAWVVKQAPDPTWQHDPLFDRLDAKRFEDVGDAESLRQLRFERFDTVMLQEAVWIRDVSRWVAVGPTHDPRLNEWLDQLSADRGPDHAQQATEAARLFDWVIRNIQLDRTTSLLPGEPLPLGPVTDQQLRDADGVKYPWETLMSGHGDFIERARVFIQLARQRHIPAVMLGTDGPGRDFERPWAVATLIDDSLYLWDTRLGIPIPGPESQAIATLSQVIDQPELATNLYEGDTSGLGISRSELQRLVALIDATPTYLSQRMKMIESQLTGDRTMVLSIAATPLRRRIETLKGVAQVRIWVQPYDGFRYHRELTTHSLIYHEQTAEMLPLESRSPLSQARILHFRGQADRTDEGPGAKRHYMDARTFERDELRQQLQQQLSETKLRNNPSEPPALTPDEESTIDRAVDAAAEMADDVKARATLWLGLLCFDKGEYDIARQHFAHLLEQYKVPSDAPNRSPGEVGGSEESPKSDDEKHDLQPWLDGARYNLARTREIMANTDNDASLVESSIELLESDQKSPQSIGNRWRAEWLRNKASAPREAPEG